MRLGEPDASGRARPSRVPGAQLTVELDAVVVATGQEVARGASSTTSP